MRASLSLVVLLTLVACDPDPSDTASGPGPDGDPEQPADPTAPVDPTDPTDPTDPVDPTADECAATGITVDITKSAPTVRANDRLVEVSLSQPASVALLCVDDADPDEAILMESDDAVDEHTFQVQAMRFGATYTCSVAPTCPTASQAPDTFALDIDARPTRISTVTIDAPAPPDPGYVLTAVKAGGGCFGALDLVVFDTEGELRWTQPLDPQTTLDIEVLLLDPRTLVWGGGNRSEGPFLLDLWDGEIGHSTLPGVDALHHDGKLLPDGRMITLEKTSNNAGWLTWTGFGLRTHDPITGIEDWSYDSQLAVDDGELDAGFGDVYHANWVDWKEHPWGPQVYVSLCFSHQILSIDPLTNTVLWRMEPGGDIQLVDGAGQPLPDDAYPQCQHGLEVSDDGTRFLVYDNGQTRGQSRAFEMVLDPVTLQAELAWEWTEPDWYEGTLGDIDWLADDHVSITQAHASCWGFDSPDQDSEIVELDTGDGEVVWRMTLDETEQALYRSERLTGCAVFDNAGSCPDLAARRTELAGLGLFGTLQ